MELTWTVPVALILILILILILTGAAYAIFARCFVHRERIARIHNGEQPK